MGIIPVPPRSCTGEEEGGKLRITRMKKMGRIKDRGILKKDKE
jgi:hypothetical protein